MEFITFDRGLSSLDRKDKVQYSATTISRTTLSIMLLIGTLREMDNILCCSSYVVLLSAIRLNVSMTSAVRLSVFILNVMAPSVHLNLA